MHDEKSLIANINAIRTGYTQRPDDPHQIVCPPYTRQDVDDMLYIRRTVEWFLMEIKTGGDLTDKRHSATIRDLCLLDEALERKRRDYNAKAGYNPNQPRVPAGNPTGGEWTDASGGSGTGKPRTPSDNEGYGRYRVPKPQSAPQVSPTSGNADSKVPRPPKQMRISKEGVNAIVRHESFESQVYLDTAKKPTIGYGHLIKPGESFPNGVTEAEAQELFRQDLREAENTVRKHVQVELTQPQYDALTSLTYNIGSRAFRSSTLLRHLNNENFDAAAEQFRVWNKVTEDGIKKPDSGLTNRRREEEELFRSGIPDKKIKTPDKRPL